MNGTQAQAPSEPSAQLADPSPSSRPSSAALRQFAMDYLLPLFLFTVSIVTTTAIGARFMHNFLLARPVVVAEGDLWPWPWLLAQPSRFLLGWPFSAALLGILLTHEFGHYFACRAHGIRATLPWVLPAPSLSGTAGAVIQIRSRIPNRRALVDVGVYGPLAGYLASLIVLIIGFLLSHPAPASHPPALVGFGEPLTLRIIPAALSHLHIAVPAFSLASCHPILIAGWIGLFITALNLIPGGQLDGGHLLYALSPRWHRHATRVLPWILLLCGIVSWLGWLLWATLLFIPAMRRHPVVNMHEPLGRHRRLLCLLALIVFVLTFAAQPFTGSSVLTFFK